MCCSHATKSEFHATKPVLCILYGSSGGLSLRCMYLWGIAKFRDTCTCYSRIMIPHIKVYLLKTETATVSIFEPVSSKRYKLACAHIENSEQPAHPCNLIRVFDGRSMGSKGAYFSLRWKIKTDETVRLRKLSIELNLLVGMRVQRWLTSLYAHANWYLLLDSGSFILPHTDGQRRCLWISALRTLI